MKDANEVMNEIKFHFKDEHRIVIMRNGKEIGHIITPSDSLDRRNTVQICGFSDAYSLWGCGVYKGFKDIQLHFGKEEMAGVTTINNNDVEFMQECCKCYRKPCQCENKEGIPFNVKSAKTMKETLETMKLLKENDRPHAEMKARMRKRMEQHD